MAGKPAKPIERGSGAILLVDDEKTVRTVTRRILEYIGFEVLTAEDGRDAIEVFKKNADAIRCVILDLTPTSRIDWGESAWGIPQ